MDVGGWAVKQVIQEESAWLPESAEMDKCGRTRLKGTVRSQNLSQSPR